MTNENFQKDSFEVNESICHKVNDPKADYSGDLGEGKVGHEPRLEPCWSMLLIDPLSAMWV